MLLLHARQLPDAEDQTLAETLEESKPRGTELSEAEVLPFNQVIRVVRTASRTRLQQARSAPR